MDKKQKKILCNIAFVMIVTIITLLILLLLINTDINTEQIEVPTGASISEILSETYKTYIELFPTCLSIAIAIAAFKKAVNFTLNILYENKEREDK